MYDDKIMKQLKESWNLLDKGLNESRKKLSRNLRENSSRTIFVVSGPYDFYGMFENREQAEKAQQQLRLEYRRRTKEEESEYMFVINEFPLNQEIDFEFDPEVTDDY